MTETNASETTMRDNNRGSASFWVQI